MVSRLLNRLGIRWAKVQKGDVFVIIFFTIMEIVSEKHCLDDGSPQLDDGAKSHQEQHSKGKPR